MTTLNRSDDLRAVLLAGGAAARRALGEIAEKLAGLGTLKIPQLDNGLFAATSGHDLENASGYQHAWLRDNTMVAYSRWHCGDVGSALRTIESLERFLMSQERRMRALIDRPEGKEDAQNRPHVRFEAGTLKEIPTRWAHAQNDALADVVWLRLLLAENSNIPLSSDEAELLGLVAGYLGAIEYWHDRDSGPWEEQRKVNSSSVGTVVAALRAVQRHRESAGAFQMLSERELALWIASGEETLKRQLPFESPPGRRADAALLLLAHPLHAVDDRRIVSLARARLEGEHGIRRYVGDSYFCQDYDEWFPANEQSMDFSESNEVRDEFLRPGCEAQWCLFDPILSVIYGRRFREEGGMEPFKAQVRYLNRALAQLTEEGQCAELYYLKGTEWVPNDHTPLGWTQANLMVALHDLKLSLDRIS